MKQLDNFIQEKLKITSKTKLNNGLLDRIISLLPIPGKILDKVTKEIDNWINGKLDHNKKVITDVVPIAYPTDIDKFEKQGGSKEAIEEYSHNNSLENCEMCKDEYQNTYYLCSTNMFEMRYNESILIFISQSGYILYLYNEKDFIKYL